MSEVNDLEKDECEQRHPTSSLREKAAHFSKKLNTNPNDSNTDTLANCACCLTEDCLDNDDCICTNECDSDNEDCCKQDDCRGGCCDDCSLRDDCCDFCCDEDCEHKECCFECCPPKDCCPKRGIGFANVLLSLKDIR